MNSKVGQIFITNEGYKIEIIEYIDLDNCTIKFDDGNEIDNIKYRNVKKGEVKNMNHKSMYNIGYLGYGNFKTTKNGRETYSYKVWRTMIQRCYDVKLQIKKPTYIGCRVCDEWHNYQNFGKWFEENYIEGFALDKDILFKYNKIYSPDTCCFVPQEINALLVKSDKTRGILPIGVRKQGKKFRADLSKVKYKIYLGSFDTPQSAFIIYKEEKEKYIKEITERWKDKITSKCYTALINYKVEITD